MTRAHHPTSAEPGIDLRPITSVLLKLPAGRKWTPKQRQKWINALTGAVDLVVDVVERPSAWTRDEHGK